MHAPDDDETERPRAARTAPRTRRTVVAIGIVLLLAVGLTALIVAETFVDPAATNLMPGFGHDGEQVPEPDVGSADDGLAAATRELHAHLNWLIWGPSRATLSANFSLLADRTVTEARAAGEDDIAALVTLGRDLVVHDGSLREGHDAIAEAERLANGGEPTPELYQQTPDPDVDDD